LNPSIGGAGERLSRGRCQKKEPARTRRKSLEAEAFIESNGVIVFGVNDDCEYREGAPCAQYASHGISQEEFPDSFPAHLLVAGKPTDEGGRDRIVSRQLAGKLVRQIVDRQGERTQAVEPDDATLVVDCDEYTRNISLFVPARPPSKPVVKRRLTAGEG
jgi:hypothetical protein